MRRFHLGLGALCVGTTLIAVACSGSSNGGPGGGSDASLPDGATSGDGAPDNEGDGGRGDTGVSPVGDAQVGSNDGGPTERSTLNVVVDQFGYRTHDEKIAVIRSPRTGFDATGTAFAPGPTYAVVNATSSAKVYEAAPVAWNKGATDHSSGDGVWHFDFSSVVTAGTYYVVDESNNAKSPTFRIADDVYKDTLIQATRMLYYQRDGIAKTAAFAGSDWADGVAHPQNAQCTPGAAGATGSKDLHGGWFDAGDQNKYTSSAAGNVVELLRAYVQTPSAFGDATKIPESGNGVPDVLDEAKWALDWLGRMQNSDGSLLSVVANTGKSPPSSDSDPCLYGSANTSSTWSAAAAFAYASVVFQSVPAIATAYPGYATTLATQAANAWTWASANPAVVFQNVPAKLGTREQEVDNAGRINKSVEAAVYLFELTGTASYKTFVDSNYTQVPTVIDPFNPEPVEALLEYTRVAGATPATVTAIQGTLGSNGAGFADFGAEQGDIDPYLAYLPNYPEGSNRGKVGEGNLALDVGSFSAYAASADGGTSASAPRYAERYIHYIHGVNPLGLVYISNMAAHGATRSVTQIFDQWFFQTSPRWSTVTATTPGPAPGFLTAGPNNLYNWDSCCPNNCGVPNACGAAVLAPPAGQPDQKSYLDFNWSYPYDSWQVSESYDLTETQYIRLLSKFAN